MAYSLYGIHLHGVYVHAGSIMNTSPNWSCESKDTPCMHMHFLCYGLLTALWVVYLHIIAIVVKHASMSLLTHLQLPNCMDGKMHAGCHEVHNQFTVSQYVN